MAYDLSTVRQNVRDKLDDDDYDEGFLDRAINYAQWKITNKLQLDFLEDSTTIVVNPGDTEIDLPANYREKLHLLIVAPVDQRDNITETFLNYKDFLNRYIVPAQNQPSQPYWWSEYGRKIKLAAPADKEYTLQLNFLRKSPTLVEDTDVPDIPEEFQELLELGAYMRIAKREDDYDVKAAEQQDYEDLRRDLIAAYGRAKRPGGMRKMRTS